MVGGRVNPTHSTVRSRRAREWLFAAAALAALASRRRLAWRVRVDGASMTPALQPGDRLLVVRGRRYRRGDLVAVRDPRSSGRLLVKRVRSVDEGMVDVRGDNESQSTDSRHFGPVPRRMVAGRVVYRYHPTERAGRPK